ncbi:CoA transferase [Candidatus Acetothermia bacterium]|nr:CoA transferase [Candidatus Acetothermia bacterium]MBI3642752.1 CoA transferase [Candidatus Acetothermia bacterium]
MKDLLQGTRVLDLTRLLPGPYATLLLADLGAEVIKIEEPVRGDPVRSLPPFHEGKSARFLTLNRNKKSLSVDLKKPKGVDLFLKLAESSDVVIEGFRPGVTRRLGIDYDAVKERNSEIIYCALTGYGQVGLYRDHIGHDLNYIARAGLLSLTGSSPVIPGVPVADLAGAMFAALSVVAALRARDYGQGGTFIDVSLTDAVISWMAVHFAEYFPTEKVPNPQELVLTGGFPCYAIYETKDKKYLAIGALEEKFWANLCNALGRPEYIPLQFSQGMKETIFCDLREIFKKRPRDAWLDELNPNEIPVSPVLDLSEVAKNPHVHSRGLMRGEPISEVAFPVRWSEAHEKEDRPAPNLGEQNWEILREIGYPDNEIESLKREHVI